MIITRTPFRVSFVGGGTDQARFYRKESGCVISTTLDKYLYVTVSEKFDGRVHLRYSQVEEVDMVDELKHTIVRECLKLVGLKRGVEIVTISDIPARGSGLGSSSALTVGLLHALYEFKGVHPTPEFLAQQACRIEIDFLKSPIGRQDQYAAAFGGLNLFEFKVDDTVSRTDLRMVCNFERLRWLERATMLIYMGEQRSANEILKNFVEDLDKNFDVLSQQKQLVRQFQDWLMDGTPYEVAGALVDKSWELKKAASPVASTETIEKLYELARTGGALGAKVCGAGGAGFMLVLAPEGKRDSIREKLGRKELPVRFSEKGSEVIYRS